MIAVILSSQFVEINLQVEFGKILPIELPLFNKTLFDHQVKSLEGIADEVFVTLPQGYKPNLIDYSKTIYVEENLSIVEVLKVVSRRFSSEETLFIYYGDTLIINKGQIVPGSNYSFIQKPKFHYDWATSAVNGYVYAGGFILNNQLLQNCVEGIKDFSSFLENLNISASIEQYTEFTWFDFGHPFTYYDSRKLFLESRAFNRLDFQNGFLRKSSTDIFKVWCEFSWLLKAKGLLFNLIPQVKDFEIKGNEASYKVEYINKAVLSDVFVFGNQSEPLILEILESIKAQLNILTQFPIKYESIQKTENFLNSKLKERESEIYQMFDGDLINSQKVHQLISENLLFFSEINYDEFPMHGDLCFSNIIYDFSSFTPLLIDPRGYLSRDDGFSFSGPKIYDILKLAHSYIAGYDFIVSGYIDVDFFEISNIKKRLDRFLAIFDVDQIELIMGMKNLFLSMLPLHKESPKRISGFLYILNQLDQL